MNREQRALSRRTTLNKTAFQKLRRVDATWPEIVYAMLMHGRSWPKIRAYARRHCPQRIDWQTMERALRYIRRRWLLDRMFDGGMV